MANGWGILSWGQGNWNAQGDSVVTVTGQQLTGETGNLDAYNLSGWGRLTWGSLSWGGEVQSVIVELNNTNLLTTTALSSVNIGIGPDVPVFGEQLSLTENSVSFVSGDANAPLTGDESVRLVTTLNSVSITVDGNTSLTGEQLTLTEDSVIAKADVNVSITGEELNTFEGSVFITATAGAVPIDGFLITHQLGELDIGPDASVSGEQVPVFLGTPFITGDANLSVSDGLLTLSLGSAQADTKVPADVTGEELTTTLNSVTATISVTVPVAGEQLQLDLLPYLYTTLHDSMTTYDTSAFVNDLNVFIDIPDSGTALINTEYVFYGSIAGYPFDANTFILQNLTRGLFGTTIATHPVNAPVILHAAAITTADANVSISGQQLTLTEGVVDSSPDAEVFGQQLTTATGSVFIRLDSFASVTGGQLTLTEGIADAGPDANLTGQQLTTVLNNVTTKLDVGVLLTTITPNAISRIGQVTVELKTPVNVTGQALTLALGTANSRVDADVYVTGINLTGTLAQLYPTAWEIINTGQTVNWTPVDTAA